MAVLFDTTVGVLLLRREPPAEAADLLQAADAEIRSGTALLPAVGVSELMMGEWSREGDEHLSGTLSRLRIAPLSPEAASNAGSIGAFLATRDAAIPLADLLIAATALWLDVPLLAWDADYARAKAVAQSTRVVHPGAELLRALELHPASRSA